MAVKAAVFVTADPKRTRQALEKLPQPWFRLLGRFDAVTFLQNETVRSLTEAVGTQIGSHEGILRTETFPILREISKAPGNGAAVRGLVLVRAEPSRTEQVLGALAALPETSFAAAVNGRFDVLAQIGAPSWEELSGTILEKVRRLEGVLGTETLPIAN